MNLLILKKTGFLLFGIIIIAAVLRLWQIGQVPIAPDWDEAALGYNAYSILHTGRDEYGAFLPVVLRSFGDYKPALYTYLIIPFIPIFDLNEVSVRLPSVIFGIIGVFITYFLIKELTKRKDISLLSAFLLAISPWHLQFSRIAFESNVGLALNLLGIFFFLKGLKRPLLLCFSSLFFAISLYAYQSEKVFVPLMMIILAGIFWKQFFAISKKYIVTSIVVLFIVSLPILLFTFTNKDALARAQGVSVFAEKTTLLQNDINRLEQEKKNHDSLGLFFDNRRFIYAKAILGNYLSHFDLNWLFFKGDTSPRHHAPLMGLFYAIELPFLLIGFYQLIFEKFIPIDRKTKLFLLFWLLVTPIPASITTDVPHAVRTLNFLPTFQIFIALGIMTSFFFINNVFHKLTKLKITIYLFFLALSFLNISYYLDQYFVQQNYFITQEWQYGYRELIAFLKPIHNNYHKVVVSDKGTFDQSYIFFLFYLKYDPKQYLAEGGTRISGIEQDGNKFSNFEFRPFNYYKENDTPLLLVGSVADFPEVFKRIKIIDYPDSKEAMFVVEKQ